MTSTRSMLIWGVAATLAACGGQMRGEGSAPDLASSVAEPLAGTCSSTTATGGWINGAFGWHSGSFTVDVDLTPAVAPSDALFGLSAGVATTYSNLANIVRFNPNGFVDVRSGSVYAADRPLPYQAGTPLHFSIDVNTASHTYSVRQGSTLASNYAFRTEQAGTSALDHYALKVDDGGSLTACNVAVTDSCRSAEPNSGFANRAFPEQNVFFTSTFSAAPNANGIDGVIGFSSQSAASFNDLAAAVRFNPDGRIDVRNGGAYAADANVPYSAGASYVINVLIDVLGHSYSVLVNGATVARDYAFRPQQASVASLGNWAWIADSSVGALSVCGLQALTALDTRYLHSFVPYEGRELAAPADGSLAVSNSADTIFLDGTGRAMGSLAYGGTPATDAHSNLYLAGEFQGSYDGGAGSIASLGGTDVYLSKYDGAHRHLWTLGLGSASDDALGTLSVNAEGDSLVGVGSQLIRLSPDGANTWSQPLAAANERCALDPNGGAFVLRPSYPDATSFTLTRVDASGNAAWARSFHEQGADVRFVRSDPAGNAILSGGLNGSIDFVAGTLKATSSEDGEQVFIAKLDQDGRYLWGAIADMNSARAMVVDSAGRTVISGYRVNPFEFRLVRFSADGNGELAEDGSSLTGGIDFGFGLELAVNTTGDVFWHFAPSRPNQNLSFLARISG